MLNFKPSQLLAVIPFAIVIALPIEPAIAGTGSPGTAQVERQMKKSPVLPAGARALGYSLYDMARATGSFNVTDHSGAVPNTPFKILYVSAANPTGDFSVMQGQLMYVPLLYNDDSLPIIGNFPSNAEDRSQLLSYWFSQSQFGAVITEISVDGQLAVLGSDYVVGVNFSTPLPDGAKQYATTAVFIHPLPPGKHTIEYHFRATGDALKQPPFPDYFPGGVVDFRQTYTVTVH